MLLKVADISDVHSYLSQQPIIDPDMEDYKRQEIEEKIKKEGGNRFQFTPVLLPFPLHRTGLQIIKRGGIYSAFCFIEPHNRKTFKDLTEKLVPSFREKGYLFVPASNNGGGYVSKNNQILTVIGNHVGDAKDLTICVGAGGAIQRELTDDVRSLSQGISDLIITANILINACLGSRRNLDETLYFAGV